MHGARSLLDLGDEAVRRLARRGYHLDLTALEALTSRRSSGIRRVEESGAESKRVAAEVGKAAKGGGDATELKEQARQLKEQVRESEEERENAEGELRDLLLTIPNLPADDVPDGDSDEFNVELRSHGTPPSFSFTPKDHVDLGEEMGVFDFGRAAKLSGSRFGLTRGPAAVLERSLATFFLTMHTGRHGYAEVSVPNLVNR